VATAYAAWRRPPPAPWTTTSCRSSPPSARSATTAPGTSEPGPATEPDLAAAVQPCLLPDLLQVVMDDIFEVALNRSL
jgi:hypothetical protein